MFTIKIKRFQPILDNPPSNVDNFRKRITNLNLEIPKPNQAIYGTTSLRSYGPTIWNALPYHIKGSNNLNSLKAIIKCWDGSHCICRVCEHTTSRQQTLAKT